MTVRSDRFVRMTAVEAKDCANEGEFMVGSAGMYTDFYGYLVDTHTNMIVFCDYMEPEDATLAGDLAPVVELLNELARQIPAAKVHMQKGMKYSNASIG